MTYVDLVIEVLDRLGMSNKLDNVDRLMGRAEAFLDKKLELGGSEKEVTLTPVSGVVTLPTDFSKVRQVMRGTKHISAEPLYRINAQASEGYAIKVGTMVLYPASDTDVDLHYYAKLPGLVANSTNWLLDSEPEIYIHALSFQVLVNARKIDEALLERNYLDQLISDVHESDTRQRFRNTRVIVNGPTP